MNDTQARISMLREPVLLLKGTVLFPGISLPIQVSNIQGIQAIDAVLESPEKTLIVVTMRESASETTKFDEQFFHEFGTRARIGRMNRIDDAINITLSGLQRVKVETFFQEKPYWEGIASEDEIAEDPSPETEAIHREIIRIFHLIHPGLRSDMGTPIGDMLEKVHDPLHKIYLVAVILGLEMEKQQKLLEARTRHEACNMMHDYISYEYSVQKIRDTISNRVSDELGKAQREYVLRSQLNEIQKELGEEFEKEDLKSIHEQIKAIDLPGEVAQEVDKIIKRLGHLTEISPDYQVTYSHLKFIADLPWHKQTTDQLDLEHARKILDEDHYNLADVKQRMIEHLAVLQLNPSAKAPILCFVGPPGVGKTSLGQSIARALGRKFERMSLGGVRDEAELRGHRRTYVGAMPGRILESIRRAGVKNPLIMLDEIDKLGVDFRGDPAAALMEILDPAQNCSFHDNYLDLPFDLSYVFFITTANTTENISKPLLDRMETIRLAGYTDYEKLEIAKQHLIAREFKDKGIFDTKLKLSDETLLSVIRNYTREAGVRELQRCLARIARKIATNLARQQSYPTEILPENLHEYLGSKQIFMEQFRHKWGIGIATGLAWTDAGGDIIYIESMFLKNRKNELKITGHVGEIMRESVQCAVSYVAAQNWIALDSDRFSESGLHIHIPAGAIPKDGPSAGLAVVVALASLSAQKPARQDMAMSGEITLSGLLLPIGGVKEKVLAAHRAGIHHVILPRANEKDIEEIPLHVKHELQFTFAEDVNEIINIVIPGIKFPESKGREGGENILHA
ncbi:MAG: endopeptidase La [Oligoflexus sp.]